MSDPIDLSGKAGDVAGAESLRGAAGRTPADRAEADRKVVPGAPFGMPSGASIGGNGAPPRGPVPDSTLHAWVDDRLSPLARSAVEQWLAQDPAAQARAQAWLAHTRLLRDAFAALPEGPHRLRLPGADMTPTLPSRLLDTPKGPGAPGAHLRALVPPARAQPTPGTGAASVSRAALTAGEVAGVGTTSGAGAVPGSGTTLGAGAVPGSGTTLGAGAVAGLGANHGVGAGSAAGVAPAAGSTPGAGGVPGAGSGPGAGKAGAGAKPALGAQVPSTAEVPGFPTVPVQLLPAAGGIPPQGAPLQGGAGNQGAAPRSAASRRPHTLVTTLPPEVSRMSANAPWLRPAGLAAAVLLVFGVGLIAGRLSATGMDLRAVFDPRVMPARAMAASSISRQAAQAWLAYAPEVRHPVEVGANEEQHLVNWLTKRLGAPDGAKVRAPVLREQGWTLLGGRLLPAAGETGKAPVALLMYENASGKRLSLLVRREAGNTNTAFSYAQEGNARVFYWIDGPFGYALAADIPQDELAQLSRVVYSQLNP